MAIRWKSASSVSSVVFIPGSRIHYFAPRRARRTRSESGIPPTGFASFTPFAVHHSVIRHSPLPAIGRIPVSCRPRAAGILSAVWTCFQLRPFQCHPISCVPWRNSICTALMNALGVDHSKRWLGDRRANRSTRNKESCTASKPTGALFNCDQELCPGTREEQGAHYLLKAWPG